MPIINIHNTAIIVIVRLTSAAFEVTEAKNLLFILQYKLKRKRSSKLE